MLIKQSVMMDVVGEVIVIKLIIEGVDTAPFKYATNPNIELPEEEFAALASEMKQKDRSRNVWH